jgi:hypothetical protein
MINLATTTDSGLQVTGYTQANLVSLGQRVQAWNFGAKPVIVGTQLALVNVLPDDSNYRYSLDDSFARLGYIQDFAGFSVICLPQVADYSSPFKANLITNSYLFLISPSSQKLVKLLLEGSTITNTTQPFENSNLLTTTTIQKSWNQAVITNAVAGTISL